MRKVFEFYGWMMIIAAVSMALYAMFASDVSALGDDNPEGHRQVLLFMSVPMSIGMGVLFIMIGRGGTNASSPPATGEHETSSTTTDDRKS